MSIIGGTTTVDPNSQSAQSQAQLEEDLNQFLTLLITQLQNQDPLDPMDATEFTSQLVQFASVEQQIYQNSNLETLVSLTKTQQVSQMVDFIGNQVEVLGQEMPLENGASEFHYIVPQGAVSTEINIISGTLSVFNAEGETSAGKHAVSWDGTDKSGVQLPDGNYTIVVTSTDADGNLLPVETTVTGRVTGAGADENNDVFLFLGNNNLIVDQSNVLSVKEYVAPTAESSGS